VCAGYAVKSFNETDYGLEVSLGLVDGKNLFGEDVATLQMSVYFDTEVRAHHMHTRVHDVRAYILTHYVRVHSLVNVDVIANQTRMHVKIFDPNNERWEVPRVVLTKLPAKKPARTEYKFSYTAKPFGFAVSRRSTGEVLFNTTTTGVFNGLVFEDQYLEISTQLSPNANIYGIGEHVKPLRLNTTGFLYTLWANGTSQAPSCVACL
jgi:alpha-glucosidase (family GH31 glycosyl hydrolase)